MRRTARPYEDDRSGTEADDDLGDDRCSAEAGSIRVRSRCEEPMDALSPDEREQEAKRELEGTSLRVGHETSRVQA